MREIRLSGSEGGGGNASPYPYRGGTSLRQMSDWVAGGEEWVAINEQRYNLRAD